MSNATESIELSVTDEFFSLGVKFPHVCPFAEAKKERAVICRIFRLLEVIDG